ncbi:abscission/NoCut checkpoint regulator [Sergentomyia squamirostris]
MSCRGCTKKYGLFLKEIGCPKCKFSFCKNCIKYSIEDASSGKKVKVCLSCLSSVKKPADVDHSPPEAYQKRLEQLGVKNEPPVKPLNVECSAEFDKDEDIRKRLEKLREDRQAKNVPTEEDMRKRLAELRGEQHKEYSNAHVFAVDKRSEQQKLEDLLKQYSEEAAIREAHDPAKDIEKRLAALKGNPLNPSGSNLHPTTSDKTPDDESEDEETAARKIAQKYLEESALEDNILDPDEKELISSLPPPSKDTEELPWCTICNEDATIRCTDCDGELFCRECFKDIHDDEEYKAHRTKAYKGKGN